MFVASAPLPQTRGSEPSARRLYPIASACAALALCLAVASASARPTLAAADVSAAVTDKGGCHALTGARFGDARVVLTERVSPPWSVGSIAAPAARRYPVDVKFCRVVGVARPGPESEIGFEVWLPERRAWNGRLQGVGNGGFAGAIAYGGLAWAVKGGYAVAATDTGHVGDPSESKWALGHPERIVDLGWRAMHETTVAAKAVVTAFYGRAADRAYYSGCSTGGRQGLVLAQRFPADYDGIVVGAPAYDWARLLAFDAVKYRTLLSRPDHWLSPAKLAVVQAASLKACRATAGLIDDPGACRFDPATVRCRTGSTAGCLTRGELDMVRLMYGGLADARGRVIYPGFSPGLESSWGVWNIGGEGQAGRDALAYPYPTGFYGALVHQDPRWSVADFRLEQDLPAALDGPVGRAVYAQDPDLRPFFARGGRLIQYHGWQDPAIPAAASVRYYREVSRVVGEVRIRDTYRLFMGTGMQHCGGGPGPNVVGGVSGEPPQRDARHDVVEAVARWVEKGVAPVAIVATHRAGNAANGAVDAQRLWCPWPSSATFIGGDRSLATSWRCSAMRSVR